MKSRLNFAQIAQEPLQAMNALEKYLEHSSLEPSLRELIKIRASQINGCAYCLDMHTQDARAVGETEQRLYTLSAWRETPFFSERERAALAFTEAVTEISSGGASDAVYAAAQQHFSEQELVALTWAIVAINAWNRVAITFHAVPGFYRPAHKAKPAPAAV